MKIFILSLAVFLMTDSRVLAEEQMPIKLFLPWVDRPELKIGMDRKSFEKANPRAKLFDLDDYSEEENIKRLATWTYTEIEGREQGNVMWWYSVQQDRLSSIIWLLSASRDKKQSVLDRLVQIRKDLSTVHGKSFVRDVLRRNREGLPYRMKQEVFRMKNSELAVVLDSSSEKNSSGVRIGIIAFSKIAEQAYENQLKTLKLSKSDEVATPPDIVDLLELVRKKGGRKAK